MNSSEIAINSSSRTCFGIWDLTYGTDSGNRHGIWDLTYGTDSGNRHGIWIFVSNYKEEDLRFHAGFSQKVWKLGYNMK